MFGGLISFGWKDIFENTPCLVYWCSLWRHRFGKLGNTLKYKNLNIWRTEHDFYMKQKYS